MPLHVHSYPLLSEVQDKQGRVKKKVEDLDGAKWVGRGRYNYMMAKKVELGPNDRVFHIDGDVANDDPKNLVAIKFNAPKYNLKTSRAVWIPKTVPVKPFVMKKKQLALAG